MNWGCLADQETFLAKGGNLFTVFLWLLPVIAFLHVLYYLQPGIAASVVYRDQVVFSKGFGVKDKSKPGAPDGSTIFRIGSVSKVFAVSLVNEVLELYINLCASPCGGIARMENWMRVLWHLRQWQHLNRGCVAAKRSVQTPGVSFAIITVLRIGLDSTFVFLCANFCLCAIFLRVHVVHVYIDTALAYA